MTFWLSIVEKTGTFPNETIHITLGCTMHLHGHWNKMVALIKPSIFIDFNNGAKFRNYTYWLTNYTWSHCLPHWVYNHHIGNKDLVFLGHVEINS